MRLKQFVRNAINSIKAAIEVYKYGGVKKLNISYLSSDYQLPGRVVLITGGGSGIGKAIAKACLSHGANVIITGRNELKLQCAIHDFEECGLKGAKYLQMDISNHSSICEIGDKAYDLFGKEVDILINNAGVQPKEFFPNVSEDEWNRIYDTNSKGCFFMCQAFCKRWMKMQRGQITYKIINISSQGGFVGATYPYRLSKWDIAGMTEGLGKTMAKHNIIVNGIAPGVVLTNMQGKYMTQGDNVFCNQNPIQRYALPEEIAELAIFLMSDRTNFIVGHTVVCDGGFVLK